MSLTVRALPTAYDPPAGAVTVATPSCCSCCCCLATLGSVTGFTAGAAYETAVGHGRHRGLVTTMAVSALPLALVTLIVLFNVVDRLQGVEGAESVLLALVWGTTIAVYLGLAVGALRLAGAGWRRAIGVPVAVAVVLPVMFVVEVAIALFTILIIELAAPVVVWLGVKFGRSSHRGPAPTSWPVAMPAWAPPPPPPPPVTPGPSGDLPALPSATSSWTDLPTPEDDG